MQYLTIKSFATKLKQNKKNKIETNVENFVDRDFDQLYQNQICNVCENYEK